MKNYSYKIQWLFNAISANDRKNLFDIIKILGVRSFDIILFRDIDFKIIERYNDFIMFSNEAANTATIKCIRKKLKTDSKIFYIEILRK